MLSYHVLNKSCIIWQVCFKQLAKMLPNPQKIQHFLSSAALGFSVRCIFASFIIWNSLRSDALSWKWLALGSRYSPGLLRYTTDFIPNAEASNSSLLLKAKTKEQPPFSLKKWKITLTLLVVLLLLQEFSIHLMQLFSCQMALCLQCDTNKLQIVQTLLW